MLLSWRQAALAAAAAAALLLGASAAAQATVKVYESSESAALLGKVRTAKCKLKRDRDGRFFIASGTSTNDDFILNLNILDWHGFKREYKFYLGAADPNFFLSAPYGLFSNTYEIPGTPSGTLPAGGVEFRRGGKVVRLGVYLAPSSDLESGVVFAGGIKCRYPRGQGP